MARALLNRHIFPIVAKKMKARVRFIRGSAAAREARSVRLSPLGVIDDYAEACASLHEPHLGVRDRKGAAAVPSGA